MVYIGFNVRVITEMAQALSLSLIRGGPPCPCVVKKSMYVIPSSFPLPTGRDPVRPGRRESRKVNL